MSNAFPQTLGNLTLTLFSATQGPFEDSVDQDQTQRTRNLILYLHSRIRRCFSKIAILESFTVVLKVLYIQELFNPLPHMPILGSSTSAANKDMMSKTLTNGDKIFD